MIEQINSQIDQLTHGNGWILQIFVVVFLTLLFDFIQKRMLRRFHVRLERTRTPWDDALIHAMRAPASVLVWVVGLTFAAGIVEQETEAAIRGDDVATRCHERPIGLRNGHLDSAVIASRIGIYEYGLRRRLLGRGATRSH